MLNNVQRAECQDDIGALHLHLFVRIVPGSTSFWWICSMQRKLLPLNLGPAFLSAWKSSNMGGANGSSKASSHRPHLTFCAQHVTRNEHAQSCAHFLPQRLNFTSRDASTVKKIRLQTTSEQRDYGDSPFARLLFRRKRVNPMPRWLNHRPRQNKEESTKDTSKLHLHTTYE